LVAIWVLLNRNAHTLARVPVIMPDTKDADNGDVSDVHSRGRPPNHDSVVLKLLIETYGQEFCPPDPSENQTATTLADGSFVSRSTIAAILSGKTKGRRRLKTHEKLSEFFRSFDDSLPANCFRRSEFPNVQRACAAHVEKNPPDKAQNVPGRENVEARGLRDVLSFKIPHYAQAVAETKLNILGTYVTYRYAFERGSEGDGILIAREVLHIGRDGADLAFKLSFCRNMGDPDPNPQWFGGKVIPLGNSLFFVGFDFSDEVPSRGRTLFIPKMSHGPLRNCNIGLLSGTRMHRDYGPAVACTLIFRAPTLERDRDILHFIKNVTRNEPVATILNRDFGRNEEHHYWIRGFLDNRPAGAKKEPELEEREKIDGNTMRPMEGALRADVGRFERQMLKLYPDLMAAPDVKAPFKENWVPESQAPSVVRPRPLRASDSR
jgi:hypothetical protein